MYVEKGSDTLMINTLSLGKYNWTYGDYGGCEIEKGMKQVNIPKQSKGGFYK